MKSLAQILWSDLKSHPKGDGPAHQASSPEIGLPFRIAAKMLLERLEATTKLPWQPWQVNADAWSRCALGDSHSSEHIHRFLLLFHPQSCCPHEEARLDECMCSTMSMAAEHEATPPA
jgi:hypothetical protein